MDEGREVSLQLQNPMLINEIAKRVLQFVPEAALKDCRLVCTTWWKESLPRWRRTQWLNLTTNDSGAGLKPEDDEELFKDEEKLHKCIWLGKLLDLLDHPRYKLRKYPFHKVRLFKCKIRGRHWKSELFQKFYFVGGSSVTSLAIEKCTIYSEQDFKEIVFRFSTKLEYLSLSDNLYKANVSRIYDPDDFQLENWLENPTDAQPKLDHLYLSMVDFESTADDRLPLNWTQFLGHFPNVRKLELAQIPDQEMDTMLISIQILREKGTLQHLNALDSLHISAPFREEFTLSTHRLLSLELPLKFFAYDIGCGTSELEDILKIGVETLENLTIYKAHLNVPRGNFPYGNSFPKLSELTLVGPIVKDLRFLEHMPHLKTLRLYHRNGEHLVEPVISEPKVIAQLRKSLKGCYDIVKDFVRVVGNTDFNEMSHLTFPKLEELIIGKELCEAEKLEQLSRLMPNVKRLRIGLNNESFRAVCKFWRGLEALEIHPYLVDEEGFTGIVRDDPRANRFPNITDLKNLRRFGMGQLTAENENLAELTDFSLEHGLSKLKHLEVVSLYCSPEKMSDDAFEQLKANFPPTPYSSVFRSYIDDKVESEMSDSDSQDQSSP